MTASSGSPLGEDHTEFTGIGCNFRVTNEGIGITAEEEAIKYVVALVPMTLGMQAGQLSFTNSVLQS